MNTPEGMSQIEHIRFRAGWVMGLIPMMEYIHCCEKYCII